MQVRSFIKLHKKYSDELESQISRLRKNRNVTGAEIDKAAELYKQVSGHLAYTQTYYPGTPLTEYLNHLTAGAHHELYAGQTRSSRQLAHFFKDIFIELILKRRRFIFLAFLIFLFGALSGYLSVWANPSHLYAIFPSFTSKYDPSRIGKAAVHLNHPVMATSIMTNNIRVAILAYLGGITFGVATVYFMLMNGVLLGALAAVFVQAGRSYVFWAYILPHGIIELTVIFIAGGAGLYMGYRMFVPGDLPWRLRLIETTKESVQLLLGTFPLFVVAGTIEGYITPSALPLYMKYTIAGVTLLALTAYYIYGLTLRRKRA